MFNQIGISVVNTQQIVDKTPRIFISKSRIVNGYEVGDDIAVEEFFLWSKNLTANITISCTGGYTVCDTSNGTYADTLEVSKTRYGKIFVKVNKTDAGKYEGTLELASTGAEKKNITLVIVIGMIADLMTGINQSSLEDRIDYLVGFGTRFCDSRSIGIADVAPSLKEKFEDAGISDVVLQDVYRLSNPVIPASLCPNVIATIKGCKYPDEQIVIGAHWDSTNDMPPALSMLTEATGAIDNGTGTAVVLELAKAFSNPLYKPERTIKFVLFSYEERGCIGSNTYAETALKNGDKIIYMINIDMTGNIKPVELSLPDMYLAYVGDTDKSTKSLNAIIAHCSGTTYKDYTALGYDSPPGDGTAFNLYFPDYFDFTYAEYDETDPVHTYYHSPDDTADKLDGVCLTKICKAALSVLAVHAGITIVKT